MTAALLLAWLLWEPGAPALPQRLHRAFIVATECEAVGVPGVVGVAVAWRESRLKLGLVSRTHDCGVMQVNRRWSKVSTRELLTLRGGAREGCRILAARKAEGPRWICRYHSGNLCTRRGAEYEREVMRTIERLPRWAFGGEV